MADLLPFRTRKRLKALEEFEGVPIYTIRENPKWWQASIWLAASGLLIGIGLGYLLILS